MARGERGEKWKGGNHIRWRIKRERGRGREREREAALDQERLRSGAVTSGCACRVNVDRTPTTLVALMTREDSDNFEPHLQQHHSYLL